MSSKIEWCDETLNPVVGCVGPDGTREHPQPCSYCYARRFAARGLRDCQQCKDFTPHLHLEQLDKLSLWKKPRVVFMGSMTDLFNPENCSPNELRRIFSVCRKNPHHTYLWLTKCPDTLFKLAHWDELPHELKRFHYFGATVTNWDDYAERIMSLINLYVRGYKTFLSIEPMVGPIELHGGINELNANHFLNAVIVGGENGPSAQPMNPEWVRQVRDDCAKANVPFFFKGWGGGDKSRLLDGIEHNELPWRATQ